jgi:hypothetical protein
MEIHFTRHAQCTSNVGDDCVDSPLTAVGRQQAFLLEGDYDLVITSPLRRTQETLHYSKIKYKNKMILNSFQERIQGPGSILLFEPLQIETDDQFFCRVARFRQELREILDRMTKPCKVLLIGHAYYFNTWYRFGCFPGPNNAEIMPLDVLKCL